MSHARFTFRTLWLFSISQDGEEKHVRGKVCDRESNRNQDFEEQGKGMIDIIAGDGRSRQKR